MFRCRKKTNKPFIIILLTTLLLSPANVRASDVLTLEAKPNHAGNYVELKWHMKDHSQPYRYKIMQKRDGSDTAQSIPAKETAKVLNIYPVVEPQLHTQLGTEPNERFLNPLLQKCGWNHQIRSTQKDMAWDSLMSIQ